MNNDNLPTKLSFIDKLKLLFSNGFENIMLQANSTIAGLKEQLITLKEKLANFEEREASIEEQEANLETRQKAITEKERDLAAQQAELEELTVTLKRQLQEALRAQEEAQRKTEAANKAIENAEPIARKEAMGYANRRIQQAEDMAAVKIAAAESRAAEEIAAAESRAAEEIAAAQNKADAETAEAQAMKAEADKILAQKKSAGEITAGKGEEGALMTIFFEKYIIEVTEKLKADIAELEAVGGNPEQKEKFIANYQANILGSLLAYMEQDTLTRAENKKIIEAQIQSAIVSICSKYPENAQAFTKGFIYTKYEGYDGNFKNIRSEQPYTLESFISEHLTNNSYFKGEITDFQDPVQIVSTVIIPPLLGSRSQTKTETKSFSPKEHFLPRTDFSSTAFCTDPRIIKEKLKNKSETTTPVYSPDLLTVMNTNVPEAYNPMNEERE